MLARRKLRQLAADCLLQRDRTAATIAAARSKQEANRVDCPPEAGE